MRTKLTRDLLLVAMMMALQLALGVILFLLFPYHPCECAPVEDCCHCDSGWSTPIVIMFLEGSLGLILLFFFSVVGLLVMLSSFRKGRLFWRLGYTFCLGMVGTLTLIQLWGESLMDYLLGG